MMLTIHNATPRFEAREIFCESIGSAFVNASRFINCSLRAVIWGGIWLLLAVTDGLKRIDKNLVPQPMSYATTEREF